MKQGYIFVPYIIQESIPIISNNNLSTKKIIKSRYSTTNINSSYYSIFRNDLLIKRKKKIEKIKDIINENK